MMSRLRLIMLRLVRRGPATTLQMWAAPMAPLSMSRDSREMSLVCLIPVIAFALAIRFLRMKDPVHSDKMPLSMPVKRIVLGINRLLPYLLLILIMIRDMYHRNRGREPGGWAI